MKNLVYVQSGGPTSVINTSLYGAIKEAKLHPSEIGGVYGSHFGIEGLINDDLIDLGLEDENELALLRQTPGSVLGSARRKLPTDIKDEVYSSIVETVKKHNIGYIFVNGGNDSMDTCNRLSILFSSLDMNVKVIGVPKTIDNDLFGTDHSLGFPSAAKHVINTVGAISTDARCFKKGKVHVVEIMGRDAGWLTASVDLLPEATRPDLIYIPESGFNLDSFLNKVKDIHSKKGSVVVAISEGIDIPRDKTNTRIDAFGHAQLEGGALELCRIVERELNLSTRSVELSLPQRADGSMISLVDSLEAEETGRLAVKEALKGETGKMITFKRVSENPYKIEYLLEDVSKIANEIRMIPSSMIKDETRMDESFRTYLSPLIKGEINTIYKDGILASCELKKTKVR